MSPYERFLFVFCLTCASATEAHQHLRRRYALSAHTHTKKKERTKPVFTLCTRPRNPFTVFFRDAVLLFSVNAREYE